MPVKVFQATHPDMVVGLSTAQLRSHYLLTGLFVNDQVQLNYSHVERFIVVGATPARGGAHAGGCEGGRVQPFPRQARAGGDQHWGRGARVDGREYAMKPRDGLYVAMGSSAVSFESADDGNPAKFYLVSSPAHARYETVKISIRARPEDIAGAAVFLSSAAADYVHGAVIPVDGGWLAR